MEDISLYGIGRHTQMRLAVFADIHANSEALSTCLAYADHVGADGYVFLGDHITDCPYPQRTLRLMRDAAQRKPSWMLRGNREDVLIRHHEHPQEDWKPSSATGSLLYTYENLSAEDIQYLKRMPIASVIDLPGCPPLSIAHATPVSNTALVYPGSEALDAVLRTCPHPAMLSGHSHFQFRYESEGKQFVNPGSVGMPFYGQPMAQFALVSCQGRRWTVRMINVDYDKESQIRQFEESGLIETARIWALATIKTIRSGGRWAIECRQLAARRSPNGEYSERAWEEAARELGIIDQDGQLIP